MRRIIPLKIDEDTDLRATVESYRLIQQRVSNIEFSCGGKSSAVELHQLSYAHVKGQLKSQLTCTAIRGVAAEYAGARRRRRRITSPIQFNTPRALFLIGKAKRDAAPPRRGQIRIWTTAGRKSIPCQIPEQFALLLRDVATYDAVAISIKRGRLVATLAVTLRPRPTTGNKPAGVALSTPGEVAVVTADNRTMRIITIAQMVMEEVQQKTRARLERKLAVNKADGRETRSVRRVIKRLSRRHYLRTRTFCHAASNQLLRWVGVGTALVIEDLRAHPPSRRSQQKSRPFYYEVMRRRIEEKAKLMGVPVFYVSIDNRLRCAKCGSAGKLQHDYIRCMCGHNAPVSKNTALNVRNKFTVSRPWAGANQP